MKNQSTFFKGLIAFFSAAIISVPAHSQAFKRGSFVINLSEGWTNSTYSTTNTGNDISRRPENPTSGHIIGCRDPLTLEYGISNRWGVGFSSGTDFFYLDPSQYYGFAVPSAKVKSATSELTIDGSFHFFVSKRIDLSLTGSWGPSNVMIKGSDKDVSYAYQANGAIVRLGFHARYYFYKHLGVLAMASTYTSGYSTKDVPGNTVGSNYSTSIKGTALEFGLCYRFGFIK